MKYRMSVILLHLTLFFILPNMSMQEKDKGKEKIKEDSAIAEGDFTERFTTEDSEPSSFHFSDDYESDLQDIGPKPRKAQDDLMLRSSQELWRTKPKSKNFSKENNSWDSPSKRRRALSLDAKQRNWYLAKRGRTSAFLSQNVTEDKKDDKQNFDMLDQLLLGVALFCPQIVSKSLSSNEPILPRTATAHDMMVAFFLVQRYLVEQLLKEAQDKEDNENIEYALRWSKALNNEERQYYGSENLYRGYYYYTLANNAYMLAKEEQKNDRNRLIFYNCARAYFLEAKQYFSNARHNGYLNNFKKGSLTHDDDIINSIDSLLLQINRLVPNNSNLKKQVEALSQKIVSIEQDPVVIDYDKLIKEQLAKIITPRRRTALLTKLNKRDLKKIKKIRDEEVNILSSFNVNADLSKNDDVSEKRLFIKKIVDDLERIIKKEDPSEYYAAIINYKVSKITLHYLERLNDLTKVYYALIDKSFEAFNFNPDLQFLASIKNHIKSIVTIFEKKQVINPDFVCDSQKLVAYRRKLHDKKELVYQVQKKIPSNDFGNIKFLTSHYYKRSNETL